MTSEKSAVEVRSQICNPIVLMDRGVPDKCSTYLEKLNIPEVQGWHNDELICSEPIRFIFLKVSRERHRFIFLKVASEGMSWLGLEQTKEHWMEYTTVNFYFMPFFCCSSLAICLSIQMSLSGFFPILWPLSVHFITFLPHYSQIMFSFPITFLCAFCMQLTLIGCVCEKVPGNHFICWLCPW